MSEKGGRLHAGKVWPQFRELNTKQKPNSINSIDLHIYCAYRLQTPHDPQDEWINVHNLKLHVRSVSSAGFKGNCQGYKLTQLPEILFPQVCICNFHPTT